MRLLVFRFSALGDVAMCVPVICSVLKQNTEVEIDFVAPQFMHALFPKHERLNLISFDKKDEHKGFLGLTRLFKSLDVKQYDGIADLHNVLRTQVLSGFAKLIGRKVKTIDKGRGEKKELVKGVTHSPLKHTTERYADVFRAFGLTVKLNHQLHDFLDFHTTKENALGIAPFAAHQGKMYDITQMENVVKALSKKYTLHIFGFREELNSLQHWEELGNVHLVKNIGLKNELKLISSLQLMVSMDSANMHLASLAGVPVVSLWGVTHPNAGFLGYGQCLENVVQDENLTWRPTSIYGNKLGTEDNLNGMKNILPETIITKIEKALNP